jgi:hypothetical protein
MMYIIEGHIIINKNVPEQQKYKYLEVTRKNLSVVQRHIFNSEHQNTSHDKFVCTVEPHYNGLVGG